MRSLQAKKATRLSRWWGSAAKIAPPSHAQGVGGASSSGATHLIRDSQAPTNPMHVQSRAIPMAPATSLPSQPRVIYAQLSPTKRAQKGAASTALVRSAQGDNRPNHHQTSGAVASVGAEAA